MYHIPGATFPLRSRDPTKTTIPTGQLLCAPLCPVGKVLGLYVTSYLTASESRMALSDLKLQLCEIGYENSIRTLLCAEPRAAKQPARTHTSPRIMSIAATSHLRVVDPTSTQKEPLGGGIRVCQLKTSLRKP